MIKTIIILDDNPDGGSVVECPYCQAQFCDRRKVKCPSCFKNIIYGSKWGLANLGSH